MNVTYNWFGVPNEDGVSQRVFDFDDYNIYTIANFTPFYVSEERFIDVSLLYDTLFTTKFANI